MKNMSIVHWLLLIFFGLMMIAGSIVYYATRLPSGKLNITCYSCGGVTFEDTVDAINYRILPSGRISFYNKKTGNWTSLGGECVVTAIDGSTLQVE